MVLIISMVIKITIEEIDRSSNTNHRDNDDDRSN